MQIIHISEITSYLHLTFLGTEMMTENGIPEGGVAAEVGTGMSVIETVRGAGMTIGGAGAQVLVLNTQEGVAETDTIKTVGVEVVQLTGSYLI